jgi:hypothetical protein
MKVPSPSSSAPLASRQPPSACSTNPPQRPAAAPDTSHPALGRAPALPAGQAQAAAPDGATAGPAPRRRLPRPVIAPRDPQRVRKEEEIRARWAPILAAVQLGRVQEAEELGKEIGVHTLPVGSRNLADYYAVMNRQIRRLDNAQLVSVADNRPRQRIVGFDVPPPAASGSHAGGADANRPG